MKRGTFIMDGKDSDDLRTYIQDRPLIEAPLRKVNWKSGYGVDGEIPFDEEAYDNTEMEFIVVIDGDDLINDRIEVLDMLDTKGRYRDFIPYFDPTKIYRVQLSEKVKFENKYYYRNAQSASVKFTVKPYKYLIDSGKKSSTEGSIELFNPTKYVSQPIIKLEGSGRVIVNVTGNGEFIIDDIDDNIVIDSERYVSYKEIGSGLISSRNDRIMSREYPILYSGVNHISVTGDISKIEVEPRWRSLV